MGSKARSAFEANCADIDRLLEIHQDLGGDAQGRRWRLEVLNKSAIVLTTAVWEAYCEDLAAEGLRHLVKHAKSPDRLPKELRQLVARELSKDKNELAAWGLAGDGWRTILTRRLESLQQERNRQMNTPKTNQINALFLHALGIVDISACWHWPGISARSAEQKLDRFVELRGSIAHRGSGSSSVKKSQVTNYYEHVSRLVVETDQKVRGVLTRVTRRLPWK